MPVIPMLFGMNCISNVGKKSERVCDVQVLFQAYLLHYKCDKSQVLLSTNISGTPTKHVTIEYNLHLSLSFFQARITPVKLLHIVHRNIMSITDVVIIKTLLHHLLHKCT